MAFPMKPIADNVELGRLIERAVAAYKAMTPAEKREMHEAQRRSWVIGELMLEHPEMTRDEAENIYDRVSMG
jgi:hypothetical protein